jgi:hypothetical protein
MFLSAMASKKNVFTCTEKDLVDPLGNHHCELVPGARTIATGFRLQDCLSKPVELDHVMFHLDGAAVVCLLLQLGKETTSFIHLVRAPERSVVVVLC